MCGSNPTGGTKMNVIETLNANADKTPDEIVEALKPKPRETSFAIEPGAIGFSRIITNTINADYIRLSDLAPIEMRELSRVLDTRTERSLRPLAGTRPDRERSVRPFGETDIYRSTRL